MTEPSAAKSRRSPLLFVFLTVFIDLLGFGIVIPLLPFYGKAYDASELELGLLFASFSAMQFFFAPFWGRVSDRYGRRPVLIGGLVGTSASYVLFAFADSLGLLFAARLLAGFFGANVATAQAYMADVSAPENRARAMGLVGAAFGLGFTFGPWIGGELAPIHRGLPGFVAAGLSLAAATFGYFRLPEPSKKSEASSRVFGIGQVRGALGDRRVGGVMLLYFLAIFAFSSFEAWFTLFAATVFPSKMGLSGPLVEANDEQLMVAVRWAGRYFFFIGLMGALVQGGMIRPLVKRFGETRLIVVGPVILGLSLLILGVAPSWTFVVVAVVLMPFGYGINNPCLNGLLSRAAPAEEQGAYLGLNQSLASFARMTAPVLGGALFYSVGPRSPFFLGAVCLACSAVLARFYRARYAGSFTTTTSTPTTPPAPAPET